MYSYKLAVMAGKLLYLRKLLCPLVKHIKTLRVDIKELNYYKVLGEVCHGKDYRYCQSKGRRR